MGEKVQQGNDRLAQVPVVGNLLLQIIQAGAGIVADSDPQKEYQETLNKAKAQIKAIELAHI